jgi:hypothetical protein
LEAICTNKDAYFLYSNQKGKWPAMGEEEYARVENEKKSAHLIQKAVKLRGGDK